MKAKIITSVTAIALAGIFLTALAFSDSGPLPEAPEPPVEAEPLSEVFPSEKPEEGFWVCAADGVITVYHNSDREDPVKTTTTAVHTLRAADQELLNNGVFFSNYLDAMSFLEDFAP